jgi:predicted ATPase
VQVVGREEETLHIESLFIKQGVRLVTIFGMGGLGKTTLARHVARRLLPPFGNNVCYVDCEAVCELHELESAIRASLFADEVESDRPPWELIGDAKMLIVLDCLEHAVQHAAYVRHLLERCPNLQVLATSRVVLGLEMEHEVFLQGLSLKSQGTEASPAEALFLQSAARTVGAFGQRHRSKVRQLVQDLEAVPLGIVLAAGRLRHLSLDQVCEQVHANRIALLSAPSHVRGKHASMVQVIAQSFELLEARDFDLVLRASAFEGGFALEDAIRCFGDPDTLDRISRLRDHSLIQTSVREGMMRYRVPDSVREYVAMCATPGRLEEARDAHMGYYARRAAAMRSLIGRAEWTEATRSMRLELGNFRAAVRWARCRPGVVQELSVLTGALARCFLEAGLNDDFRAVASGLSAEHVDADPELGMELLGLWGAYHRRLREPDEAMTFWLRRLELGQRFHSELIVSDTLLDLADLAVSEGDVEAAVQWHQRFEDRRGAATPAALRASGSLVGAKIALARGSRDEAQVQVERAEVDAQALSNTPLSFYVWRTLSQLWRELGQFERARRHARALLQAALESDHKHYAGRALLEFAATALDAGEPVLAGKILAVAALIPRNASPHLRNSVLELKKRLPEEGLDAFEGTKASASSANWESLALEWSTGVTSPA